MICDKCGHKVEFDHKDPPASMVVVTRQVCSACKAAQYGYILGEGAYNPRQKTLLLHVAILEIFNEIGWPMTVRQVYYQLSARHVVEKEESGYHKVQRALTDMRRSGAIPYYWLSDNSRNYFHVQQYHGLNGALSEMQKYYRRDVWQNQPSYVEVWIEKRSLISQLTPVCNEYGVKLYPCGGYSSISFAYEAASEWKEIDKPIFIYHLSDMDADGAYSSVALERELRTHTHQPFAFTRLALKPEHIDTYDLHDALRPQKKTSKQYNWWKDEYGAGAQACEMDALTPADLRQLVRDAIEAHIDPYILHRTRQIEAAEKETLGHVLASLNGD
jgi:hypothetical protein